jgi:hypothetical protein
VVKKGGDHVLQAYLPRQDNLFWIADSLRVQTLNEILPKPLGFALTPITPERIINAGLAPELAFAFQRGPPFRGWPITVHASRREGRAFRAIR